MIVLALLAVATYQEQVIDLSGKWKSGGAWGYTQTVELKDAPFVRLDAPKGTALWWNGTPVAPNENGDFDIPSQRRSNTLEAKTAIPVRLKITPRVYVAGQDIRLSGGRLAARLFVRNTLENTVNAFLTIRAPLQKLEWSATATVPPGVTQTVEVMGKCNCEAPLDLEISLEKQEEAMEAGYRFELRHEVR
ncbi:MAG: hypothetical protein IT168_22925 [Bryobacterales bacterium]|nr:hypothetical protein [Bryobacterales bacterium]